MSDAGGMLKICRRKVIRFSYYTFSAARGRWKKNGGGCRRNCRTVAKAVREGGTGQIRVREIVVRGDQTEAGEAGQLDGPVPRGGTTRGPVRQIVEAWGGSPATTMAVDGRSSAVRRDGALEWEIGKQPERTFPTSHSGVCGGRGAA